MRAAGVPCIDDGFRRAQGRGQLRQWHSEGSRGRWCSSGARHGGLDCVTLGTGSTGRSRLGKGRGQGGAEPESCEGSARATCEELINACANAQHPAGRTWESFNRGFVYLRVRLVAASCLQTFRLVVVLRTGDRQARAKGEGEQYSTVFTTARDDYNVEQQQQPQQQQPLQHLRIHAGLAPRSDAAGMGAIMP
jgi:hypothetical protein